MAVWLYQMSADNYSIEEYRAEVWEREWVKWPTGNPRTESGCKVSPGDTVVLFFVRTGTKEPGIYGWGVVTHYKEDKGLFSFRPTSPSDYLKMNPVWDDDVSNLVDAIRGPMKVVSMWEMSAEHTAKMRSRIHDWIR